MSARTVITGLGAVSPLGWGVAALWEGLLAGRTALGEITRFDASPFRSGGGGEVPPPTEGASPDEGDEGDKGDEATLAERYLLHAIREAVEDSRIPRGDTALVVGTNFGGMSAAERALVGRHATEDTEHTEDTAKERSRTSVPSVARPSADLSDYEFREQAARAAKALGLGGVTSALSLSCASGTAVIVAARDLVVSGRAECAVAAGYDEFSLYAFAGLASLRAMTTDALRPFDRRRKGTLFSEGAGALVVEDIECARRRGAKPYAELLGGALGNDAYHMTAPEKEAKGIRALITNALADAGVSPDEVDHVNLHGTGTKYNDLGETKAIKHVFGERAKSIPVTANKGAIGHAMGAAGSLETIAAVLSICHEKIAPTAGFEEPDPECDLDVVRGEAREVKLTTVLKCSYGIGGANAAVVLRAV